VTGRGSACGDRFRSPQPSARGSLRARRTQPRPGDDGRGCWL